MANYFFFHQKGLALYAPDFARATWIDAEWKYPIYKALFLVKEYVNGIIGHEVTRGVPLEAIFGIFAGIVIIGISSWFKLATNMERIFVLIAALFVGFRVIN